METACAEAATTAIIITDNDSLLICTSSKGLGQQLVKVKRWI
jgi:hypothetical protein